ncbi:hypothetical protein EVAR_62147_1 [Eumeta japonica]|uniref:Uncharacterized protein n=1 Tax=Eumeta variegata TaxID=151549 RepID=A0A4C1ZFZ9_EUMVA|nr:hypothetical protein EVAR_62147_1 [Eumeta japonica]
MTSYTTDHAVFISYAAHSRAIGPRLRDSSPRRLATAPLRRPPPPAGRPPCPLPAGSPVSDVMDRNFPLNWKSERLPRAPLVKQPALRPYIFDSSRSREIQIFGFDSMWGSKNIRGLGSHCVVVTPALTACNVSSKPPGAQCVKSRVFAVYSVITGPGGAQARAPPSPLNRFLGVPLPLQPPLMASKETELG